MDIIHLNKITFTWNDLISQVTTKNHRNNKQPSKEILVAAERAYHEGMDLLDLKAIFEVYEKADLDFGSESLEVYLPENKNKKEIIIGPGAEYLMPAKEVVVVLCTAGAPIVDAIESYSRMGDYLTMYYLDAFAVRALADLLKYVRSHIEMLAAQRGWGVGSLMQPGSLIGWDVSGQRDLYHLGHGSRIGLTLNNAHFLLPHISNSTLIGIGPHYSGKNVGSMCHECPCRDDCLWRRENVQSS